ncbi:MAG: hypothetical protein M3040_08550 [Bacteroidota bacterium]|nr:hypothetical protein [Bacteroidota bacterium]
MRSLSTNFKKGLLFVAIVIASCFYVTASAQNTVSNSRIAVVTNPTKTNIWVSDFPKKTSIVVYDKEDNLLSIVSTNEFGAAYISLPSSIKTTVIVKTLDGEIKASNEAVIKNPEAQTAASSTNTVATKA